MSENPFYPFLGACQCEQSGCEHGLMECKNQATLNVATIYGVFKMCGTCATNLPREYKKPEVEVQAR